VTIRTHEGIDRRLSGEPTDLSVGAATVRLQTVPEMAADEHGLVHGGFLFGAADYAAMLAVNDPNVVLVSATTRFVAPVRVGEVVLLHAQRTEVLKHKHFVDVHAAVGEREVFRGTFVTVVLDCHVLDR